VALTSLDIWLPDKNCLRRINNNELGSLRQTIYAKISTP